MKENPRILAIVPCYNEEGAIARLLQEFRDLAFLCDTLVVDDGSSDNTAAIASEYTIVIRQEKNGGVASAMRRGIGYAIEQGYDLCVQIDGDGQHIPAQIQRLIETWRNSGAQLVIGSRFDRPLQMATDVRRVAACFYSCLIYILFHRQWFWDSTSGMRMMDRAAMDYFVVKIRQGQTDAIMLPQALHAGFLVREVKVQMRLREDGVSSFSGLNGVKFFARLIAELFIVRFKSYSKLT